MRLPLTLAALVLSCLAACASAPRGSDASQFLPGSFVPGVQPDGNTVLLDAPDGLIVVDTGRHRAHTQAIIDAAARREQPIAAVINTHWHLDHIGGNFLIREKFPGVRIYASNALDAALGGFLASYAQQLRELLGQATTPEARTTFADELALIDGGPRLAPTDVVSSSSERDIAGRRLTINLARNAATAGDVWIVDRASGTVIAGDLVTLPFPLLDTACPDGWRSALERIDAVRFATLIPGHGSVMSAEDFRTYRTAFGRLLDCAASDAPADRCAERWLEDAGTLVPPQDRQFALGLAEYYIPNSLRAPRDRLQKLCSS